jgi:hypothetical protein
MNISALCQSLDFNQLTANTMEKLKASLDQKGVTISDHEANTRFGDLEITLSHKTANEGCYLNISNNCIQINPIGKFGNDRTDFSLDLNDQRSPDDWVMLAMTFIQDALWFKESEYCFEIYNENGDLVYDRFKTKNFAHALIKAKNTDTFSNINHDDVYEVVINVDNEINGSSQINYRKDQDFFSLCDRNLSNDDIILALTLIGAKFPDTTYSIRANLSLGIEI